MNLLSVAGPGAQQEAGGQGLAAGRHLHRAQPEVALDQAHDSDDGAVLQPGDQPHRRRRMEQGGPQGRRTVSQVSSLLPTVCYAHICKRDGVAGGGSGPFGQGALRGGGEKK